MPIVAQDRYHAFDAVRAFALLAGIVQHGSMSFVAVSSPVQDISQSWILSVTYYVIHIFRMGLFFMIAGFFARILLYRRGTRAFVQDRLMRIFVPMVVGWCIFGTLAIVILHWGIARTSGPSNSVPWGFTFLHFWFLYYLIIFYVLALTLREAFDGLIDRNGQIRRAIDTIVHGATSSYTAPIILAAPLFVVLLHRNEAWNMWFGIPTAHGFGPEVAALVGYGSAFGFGWFLHRQTKLLGRWQASWHIHLSIGVILTAMCLSIVGIDPKSATTVPAWSRIAYALFYTTAIWFWTFGILGVALRFCSQESQVRRYLADSSYYLYLAHLPVIFFLQAALATVPLHWAVKFPLILVIGLTVLFVSYHYWIRPTFIGALLNGRKYPRREAARARPESAGIPRTLPGH